MKFRLLAFNATTAECGGINVARNIVFAMAISGAMAGLTGVNQVMGDKHVFLYEVFDGQGFNGIGVALIGRNEPVGVFLAAIFIRGTRIWRIFCQRPDRE